MSNYSELELQKIKHFFKDDILNFKNFPIKEVADKYNEGHVKNYEINTSIIKSEKKRKEFKDYLFLIYTEEKPFKYTSKNMPYVFRLAGYINQAEWDSVLDAGNEQEKTINYFNSINLNYDHVSQAIINQMKKTLTEFYDTRTGLDRDIWYLKDINISECRKNKSSNYSCLNFSRILNEENRELIKEWFKYLLGETEMAFSTMVNCLSFMSEYCEKIGDKSLLNVTRVDFLNYIEPKKETCSVYKYNKTIDYISSFYKYLAIEEIFLEQSPVLIADKQNVKREHFNNSVSEYVILQIFNHLYELPNDLLLMYLINYSTGMRISDVCQLKVDCLIKSEKCYFLKYNVQKMVKSHAVPISTALGELIEKYIRDIISLDETEEYLFHSQKNNPKKSSTYRNNMKKWCKKWGIKNEDGTDYNYVTHAYRHTVASDLVNNYNVPLEVVQLVVLGHTSISMSLSYIDTPEERKKMINDSYVDKAGMKSSIKSKEFISPDWIKNNISKQILPNGVCCYPAVLGVCPNVDICLTCEHFRTSKKFLPVHKKQLEELKKQLPVYESNGWINNIETTKELITTLEKIIATLES